MSLPTDASPPGHMPPAGTPPWPLQPPPHGAAANPIPVHPREADRPIGALGAALIGSAVAAIGLVVALPWLRRELGGKAKSRPKRRAGRKAK
jgi:hypothetical protein